MRRNYCGRIRLRGWNCGIALIGAFLVAAFAVSLWQVRGAMASRSANLRLAVAWLFSFSTAWAAASSLIASAFAGEVPRQVPSVPTCYHDSDFATLATLPSGNVLAISNHGAAILAHTPHRILSGPYHCNIAGNLAALDVLMGPPEAVEVRARKIRADYVVLCKGNPETGSIIG